VKRYLQDLLTASSEWINHNIKYDVHVAWNYLDLEYDKPLKCTVVLSKIVDSDRLKKGGYGLDKLSRSWLREDISGYEKAFESYLHKNKDYGVIPDDLMAPYACQDVITNRRLYKYVDDRCPEQCRRVWDTEIALTSVLVKMERRGVVIDPTELKVKHLTTLKRIFDIDYELEELTGQAFRPHVNEDCFDVICNKYGLPVLEWTEEDDEDGQPAGNPSFNKHALAKYLVYPGAPAPVIERIIEYRSLKNFASLFLEPYQRYHVGNALHPVHNQCVRTGRMSCGEPNMQQLRTEAKELIHPRKGYAYLSVDYSQIEFRTIVHYIQNPAAIAAYNANPDTDFHQLVADMIGIKRKPAKTMNFMMGYGGGKGKTVESIESNADVVGELQDRVNELIAAGRIGEDQRNAMFTTLCRRKAEDVYREYHRMLPELKRTSRYASAALLEKGYVFNLYGRHRHLPADKAHIAFNTLNQSTAADIMKDRMIALDRLLQGTDVHILLNVHDEVLFEGPSEVIMDDRTLHDIINVMEHPDVQLRVPVRTSYGRSTKHWLEANKQELKPAYDFRSCGSLEHLR
jgi:DNA polymerase-1